jgi:hypothetical protein
MVLRTTNQPQQGKSERIVSESCVSIKTKREQTTGFHCEMRPPKEKTLSIFASVFANYGLFTS